MQNSDPGYRFEPGPGKIVVLMDSVESSRLILLSQRHGALGTVVAVYDPFVRDGEDIEPFYREGDRVLVGQSSGCPLKINGRVYHFLREAEILSKIIEREEVSADPDVFGVDEL